MFTDRSLKKGFDNHNLLYKDATYLGKAITVDKRHKAQARKKVYAQSKAEFKELQETFAKKHKEIYSSTKQISYKEYLMELALSGDVGASKELRK